MSKRKIVLVADHTGVFLKQELISMLKSEYRDEFEVIDLGSNDEKAPDDYPDFAFLLEDYFKDENTTNLGVAICGTGVGICIAANKIKNVRAGLVYEPKYAELAIQHDKCNVLVLGARTTTIDSSKEILRRFLAAEFEGGRHQRRVDKISAYEKK
ncbi:RpiB/LacA/LacB family sugar-phosphate isomerase [Mycoplasma bradburyae]|uniref:RpiB/LacA/LacB family sugar-phosphate isomerase n=1 Tax=Mycoplasma bradburyae TaxID=2963128 RepID=A0AAW6HQ16_9MOLU|nr:RpiB/LacA/LacB family sugar-phosphate isomerase [Mycoplasma bradburyae]MDC4183721.1 RpiB/LacA/LacB family sugar-phosphate isomerase [Mycoplasma bradburyae]UTS70772.1 RpiB/LacA/LacB family sugar-phosphate isomerase [Mycoplasma bradburyae]